MRYAKDCNNARDGSAWPQSVKRTGAVDLAFVGWHVGHADAFQRDERSPNYWTGTIADVWVSTTGKTITSRLTRPTRSGSTTYAAAAHDDPASARAWLAEVAELGHGNVGLDAWAMACRVVGDFAGMDVERV